MLVNIAPMLTRKSNWNEDMCIQKYWQNKYLLIYMAQVFSNACFYSSGQESSECFLFPKSRKSAFLWSTQSFLILEIRNHCACDCSAKSFSSFLWYSSVQQQDMTNQSRVQEQSPLSGALPLYHHHLRPFPPRAVSRFLLSQKWDSCFDNGYCGSHQMQEAFGKKST